MEVKAYSTFSINIKVLKPYNLWGEVLKKFNASPYVCGAQVSIPPTREVLVRSSGKGEEIEAFQGSGNHRVAED